MTQWVSRKHLPNLHLDNGGMPTLPIQVNKGKPYSAGLNSPLLRGKWDLTEGGIRVPFAFMGPGVEAGSQSNEPIISYDLLPTLADIAGATDALPDNLDGRAFAPCSKILIVKSSAHPKA